MNETTVRAAKMRMKIRFYLLALLSASPALADEGATATATIASGPNAGRYEYSSDDPCILAALPGRDLGFNIVLMAPNSSLSIDIPNADPARVSQAQIELVVANVKPGQSRKSTASVTYNVDTRPDASLEAYQRADRKGTSGQASVKLTRTGNAARLLFTGTTADGIRITGNVDCRKLDREYGR